jgi:hypothetical protein
VTKWEVREVKISPNWPEWQKAMCEELDLLKEKGTWELVQKPPNANCFAINGHISKSAISKAK